eukprot:6739568-Alexandrium_andersonii.AAC.1
MPREVVQADPGPTDMCRRCGAVMPERDIKWHVRNCRSELWVIPQGFDKCRKCGVLTPAGFRGPHEHICRGSLQANRTCLKCGFEFE